VPPHGQYRGSRLRYRRVEEAGLEFLFAYDRDAPELLHIYARHLTDISDALNTYFDPSAETRWNEQFRRFETYNATHGLYWFWWRGLENRVVLVITCFRL
jgi:hypothetical protein